MAHTLRPPKKISYDENLPDPPIDPSDYVKQIKIKKEPQEVSDQDHEAAYDVKNEKYQYEDEYQNEYQNEYHNEYQNEAGYSTNDAFPTSLNTWELLIKRCRFLIQEEHQHNQMNSHLMTKILVKEINEVLSNVVTFFQDCCIAIEENENLVENLLEVDGLLVNCLPCHPQNNSCHYKISNDIPKKYLETLFCPLDGEIENNYYNGDDYLPLAPEVELDVKKEVKEVKKIKKKKHIKKDNDGSVNPRKVHMCEQCGKEFKTAWTLKEHVTSHHEKKKLYKCNKCGDSYRSRSGLLFHKKREGRCPGAPRNSRKLIFFGASTGADPKCLHPDCVDKNLPRFTYAGIMKHVLELHSPDPDDSKNLQCPDCPKRFPMLSVLKFHQEKEHQAKSRICTLCGKLAPDLNRHMRITHSNEKKFQCDKCDYQALSPHILKVHKTSKHDRVEYRCDMCDYTTNWASNLTTHRRKKHMEPLAISAEPIGDL